MSSKVDDAFINVPRKVFLPPDVTSEAEYDEPLSIGFGVTNSQPSTVKHMLEWLEVRPGQKILDIGSGSGWTTGLLAHLTGHEGKVIAIERVPELVNFGKTNCEKLGINNVEFYQAGSIFGWPESAPYDRILVSASAMICPQELLDQLNLGGRLVIPVQNDILIIDKDSEGNIHQQEQHGFVFVPLLK